MLDSIANFAGVAPLTAVFMLAIALLAGLIRGFSGFALSAVVMASLSGTLAPVELLPVALLLELVAGVFMVRGGIKNADMRIVWGLLIGNTIGIPAGLYLVTWLDVETSKAIALMIILGLTSAIFFNIRASFLATRSGLYLSGLTAGLASGTAAVGGMVVALFVLARDKPASEMRGSLVMFLLISLFGSMIYFTLYDIFTIVSLKRAVVMAPLAIGGILIGSAFFNEKFERYYKPVCLIILIVICAFNLLSVLN